MKIALFDMDGTLTPPRGKMKYEMTRALARLQDMGFRLGIVTGSDMNYIKQQCGAMFDMSPVNYLEIDYFPCNGTKRYKYERGNSFETLIYENHMKDVLGETDYKHLICTLVEYQSNLTSLSFFSKIPLTGNFIDCRGSMINWCPIGRNANLEERKTWELLDKEHGARLNILNNQFKIDLFNKLTVKLGGSTSFDIFPNGWDKSYVLKNFNDNDKIFFFGDRCVKNGNDKEIYDAVLKRNAGWAFQVESPEDTVAIINKVIEGSSK